MKSFRIQRVNEQLKRELGGILGTHKDEFHGYIVTVTEARCSKDLKVASIWVSVLGEPAIRQNALKALTAKSGRLRHLLAGKISLKHTPEIRFRLDETLDEAERINNLLRDSGVIE